MTRDQLREGEKKKRESVEAFECGECRLFSLLFSKPDALPAPRPRCWLLLPWQHLRDRLLQASLHLLLLLPPPPPPPCVFSFIKIGRKCPNMCVRACACVRCAAAERRQPPSQLRQPHRRNESRNSGKDRGEAGEAQPLESQPVASTPSGRLLPT